jgi:phenylacetate-coenzyme A ligase PaaK-like adenylate-forming protein
MAFQLKRAIYESAPLWIKRGIGLLPFSWVAGKAYREFFSRNIWFDKASRQDLLSYQEKLLGAMLSFVVEQVPAYQKLTGIVKKMRPFEALEAFPLLDKNTVQAHQRDYLPRDFEKIPHYETSTGVEE